jgi:ABC-type uncharacterized transport system auxiliary subunit
MRLFSLPLAALALALSLAALALALSLAGCASNPEPQPANIDLTPQKRPLDAKTQLETGRRY